MNLEALWTLRHVAHWMDSRAYGYAPLGSHERRQPRAVHTFKAIAWPAGGWAVLVDGKLVRLLYATRDEADSVARHLTERYSGPCARR